MSMDEAEKPKKKVTKAKPAASAKPKSAASAKPKAKVVKKPSVKVPHDPHAEVNGFIRDWKTARNLKIPGDHKACGKQMEKVYQALDRFDMMAAIDHLEKAINADPSAINPLTQFIRLCCGEDWQKRCDYLEAIKDQIDEELGFDPEIEISIVQKEELLLIVTETAEVLFELKRYEDIQPLILMSLHRLGLDESASGLIVLSMFAAALAGDFDMLAMLIGDDTDDMPAQLLPIALFMQIRAGHDAAAQKILAKLRQDAPVIVDFLTGKIDAQKCCSELDNEGLLAESIAIDKFIAPFWSKHPEGRAWLLRNSFVRR
jgi:hypothetical protein